MVDEAVALLQADPGRLLPLTILPALPLALLSLGYVHLHRTVWSTRQWEDGPLTGSVLFGVLITAAYLGRGVAHGVLARHVVGRLHPAAGAPPELPVLALLSAAALGAGGTILGGVCAVIPGLFLAGWFADSPGVLAVERGGVRRALTRERPRGSVFKATRGILLTLGVGLLVWFNLVCGANWAVVVLRALTGADTGALALAVAPTNGGFLAAAAVLAFLITEPLWAVLRALLYLDARLGRSGVDLGDRWQVLMDVRAAAQPPQEPRSRSGAALIAGVLAAFLVGGGWSIAAAQPPSEAPPLDSGSPAGADAGGGDLGASASADSMYLRRVVGAREDLEAAIARYDTSGWEDLGEIGAEAEEVLVDSVPLPGGGRLQVDGRVLVEDLPQQLHSVSTRDRAARVGKTLVEAEAATRALDGPVLDGSSARQLLDEVLANGDYDVAVAPASPDRRPSGLRERLVAWWAGLFEGFEVSAPPPTPTPKIDTRWIAATLAILAIVGVLLVLGARLGERRRRRSLSDPEPDASPGSAAPDARTRTPVGWHDHARGLRADGRSRDALRAHYLGALAALDRRREIDYRPERTNGALLASFRGPPARRLPFEDATRRFEVVWYGEHSVEDRDLDEMEAACVVLSGPDGVHV